MLRSLLLAVSVSATCCSVPVIDVSALRRPDSDAERQRAVAEIGEACMEVGFFYVSNHGVSEAVQEQLETSCRQFIGQPREIKRKIEMAKAGTRWRGYFEVGEEHTCAVVDQKEGIYFAAERPDDTRPFNGANLFPDDKDAPGMRGAVLEYMAALKELSRLLLEAIGEALSLPPTIFKTQFEDPTTLFRVFHYPPHDEQYGPDSFAVGEHTDMGFLTVLKQDESGGLQVRLSVDEAQWIDVPPLPGTFVVNLGDCLERSTGGLLRATAHRVQKRLGATRGRFSFPFFFDPTFDAKMKSCQHLLPAALQARAEARRQSAPGRWDGRDLHSYDDVTYGDFVISKVKHVFPALAEVSGVETQGDDPREGGAF